MEREHNVALHDKIRRGARAVAAVESGALVGGKVLSSVWEVDAPQGVDVRFRGLAGSITALGGGGAGVDRSQVLFEKRFNIISEVAEGEDELEPVAVPRLIEAFVFDDVGLPHA